MRKIPVGIEMICRLALMVFSIPLATGSYYALLQNAGGWQHGIIQALFGPFLISVIVVQGITIINLTSPSKRSE